MNGQKDLPVAVNLIAGRECRQSSLRDILSPYDGACVARVRDADPEIAAEAVGAAVAGARAMAEMPAYERHRLLLQAAANVEANAKTLAGLMCAETAKAIRDCRVELLRAVDVTRLSAEESIRICGRQIPIGGSPVGHGKLAVSARFPVGVVAGIVPFNAPVNLTCHKLAPALAAGNAIVIKSPPQAPNTVERLVRCFIDAGFPPGAIGLLHGGADVGRALVEDPRVAFLSFTGSAAGGLAVKKAAGSRGCLLELGGVGPTIVHEDADLEAAARAVASAGFRLAGQSCASVQNLFVHEVVAQRFAEILLSQVGKLRTGDPADPETDLGPVIDERSAARIEAAIQAAVRAGARLLAGGTRKGTMLAPTVIADVTPEMDVVRKEIFGPVVVLRTYADLSEPIGWIAGTGLGINCGLFTDTNSVIQRAFRQIRAGALIVNGTSTFRPDQLPYGGVGNSGYGRESPADSVRAMTCERILVVS